MSRCLMGWVRVYELGLTSCITQATLEIDHPDYTESYVHLG